MALQTDKLVRPNGSVQKGYLVIRGVLCFDEDMASSSAVLLLFYTKLSLIGLEGHIEKVKE